MVDTEREDNTSTWRPMISPSVKRDSKANKN